MHITDQGYLTEGGEGAVNINQVGSLNPGTEGFMWPVEIVSVELGYC